MALDMSKIEAERRRKFNEEQKKRLAATTSVEKSDLLQQNTTEPLTETTEPTSSPVSHTVEQVSSDSSGIDTQSSDNTVDKVETSVPEVTESMSKTEISQPESEEEEEQDEETFENPGENDDVVSTYVENAEPAEDTSYSNMDDMPTDEGIEFDAHYADDDVPIESMADISDVSNDPDIEVQPREESVVRSKPAVQSKPSNLPKQPAKRIPSDKSSNRIHKTAPVRPASVRNDPVATVRIPEFPRALIQEVRNIYKEATTNSDALAAFTYAQLGNPDLMVSEDVKRLVQGNDADNTLVNVEQRMRHLEDMLFAMSDRLNELELILSFLVFDRVGFRKEIPNSPYEVNPLEKGVVDVVKKMRESAEKKKKWEQQSEGRPMR